VAVVLVVLLVLVVLVVLVVLLVLLVLTGLTELRVAIRVGRSSVVGERVKMACIAALTAATTDTRPPP
jgi:hypothetical protein